jgi:23S rRNA G2445 N2-methylase RlmL
MLARMNIWSRFGNILYYVLDTQKKIIDFDSYFESVFAQDWKKYIPKGFMVHIKATAIKSELGSISTLQALAKKAIAKKIVGE